MGHMINRQSHAFSYNSGNNCTRNRLNCTRLRLVQLAVARAIIPELHSKAYDYLYLFQCKDALGKKDAQCNYKNHVIRD